MGHFKISISYINPQQKLLSEQMLINSQYDPPDAPLERMKDTSLLEHHTPEGLLLELAKIKKIRLVNRRVIMTESSKRQGTILDALGVCA